MTQRKPTDEKWRDQTKLVRAGLTRSPFEETAEALYLTSGYVYPNAQEAFDAFAGEITRYQYSRYRNPTVSMFENRMAALHGCKHAFATASGMAAVSTSLLCTARTGQRVVASRALFGSCLFVVKDLMPRYGIEAVIVDGTDRKQWEAALSEPTDFVFYESPSNPMLEIIDMEFVNGLAKKAGAMVVVDNVFATPLLQNPFETGADVVVYSATKHIDGQGRVLGGIILANDDQYAKDLFQYFRNVGPSMSPFNAWVLVKALETLEIRVARHCDNARALAGWLKGQKGVKSVRYPGLKDHPQYDLAQKQMKGSGSIVTFEVDGGRAEAFKVMDACELLDIANNLGDSKTLITHPATTTHYSIGEEARNEQGITGSLIRISVGLEDVEDIKDDLGQALKKMG